MAATKIQVWWRKLMAQKLLELWDTSGDPPKWGQYNHTSCLDSDSEDGIESLFNDIEIERNKLRSKNMEDIIINLEEEIHEEEIRNTDVLSSSEVDNVFEEFIDEPDSQRFTSQRSSSVKLNVYGDDSCRANSEEFFITQHTSKLTSVNEAEFCRLTRSKSKLQRVPLMSTPLKNHIGEQSSPPGFSRRGKKS